MPASESPMSPSPGASQAHRISAACSGSISALFRRRFTRVRTPALRRFPKAARRCLGGIERHLDPRPNAPFAGSSGSLERDESDQPVGACEQALGLGLLPRLSTGTLQLSI